MTQVDPVIGLAAWRILVAAAGVGIPLADRAVQLFDDVLDTWVSALVSGVLDAL
jgi:hypothetical protein